MKRFLLLFMSIISFNIVAKNIAIISAHRGASGYEPENTLRAFEKAIKMGAPMMELDVHLSKDGDLVVIHDFYTKDRKKVSELTTQELKQYDVGKGEHVPLLSEVFDLVDQRAIINVELKGPVTAQPVAALINQYLKERNWDPKKFLISSFDHFMVREFHKLAPTVPTAVIFEGNPIRRAQIATDAGAHNAVLQYTWITPEFIKDAHARGVKVFTYTINCKQLAQKLIDMGIDGIITNYPDLLSRTE